MKETIDDLEVMVDYRILAISPLRSLDDNGAEELGKIFSTKIKKATNIGKKLVVLVYLKRESLNKKQ
jgi:hypothetical protein